MIKNIKIFGWVAVLLFLLSSFSLSLAATDEEKEKSITVININQNDESQAEKQKQQNEECDQQEPEDCPKRELRIIGGYEVSRASSTSLEGRAFADLYISNPLPVGFNKYNQHTQCYPLRVWGNVRLASLPKANSKTIGALSTEYFDDYSSLKLNDIGQSVEILGGLDITLWKIGKKEACDHYFTLGMIVAAGVVAPIASENEVIPRYKISEEFKEKYGYTDADLGTKKYVSFVPPDTNRFYRQYYLGLRLKTYGKDNSSPGMLDFSIGLNDAVLPDQGDASDKVVFRLDAFLPYEIDEGIKLYLFGTAILNTSKGKLQNPLFLKDVTNDVPISSPDLLRISVPGEHLNYSSKDFYRIGIGIDFSGLLNKKKPQKKKSE